MKICKLKIANLRSIIDTGDIPVSSLFTLVGENNAVKSNILLAVRALLTGGAGGLKAPDFHNPGKQIIIKGTFNWLYQARKFTDLLVTILGTHHLTGNISIVLVTLTGERSLRRLLKV